MKKGSLLVQYSDPRTANKAIGGLRNHPIYKFSKVYSGSQNHNEGMKEDVEMKKTYKETQEESSYHVSHSEMLNAHCDFEADVLAQMMMFGQNEEGTMEKPVVL